MLTLIHIPFNSYIRGSMATGKNITKRMLFVKCVEIIQPILKLHDWKIAVVFSNSERMKETATCEAHTEYKFAKIVVNAAELSNMTRSEIISIAIHEMSHCVLWDFGEWAMSLTNNDKHKIQYTRKYEESAITKMEHILLPLAGPIVNQQLIELGYSPITLELPKLQHYNEDQL